MLIEDKDMLPSRMNGKIYKAGKFTRSLRISLWAEHLGLHRSEVCNFFSCGSFNITYKTEGHFILSAPVPCEYHVYFLCLLTLKGSKKSKGF